MGFSRQGVRIHTPSLLLQQIESERRAFKWLRDPSLKEDEAKRSRFKGLAAFAAKTFNTPGASISEVKGANQRMLLSLRDLPPSIAPSSQGRINLQVVTSEQVNRAERFMKDSSSRALNHEHVEWLKARERLDRVVMKLIPALRSRLSVEFIVDLAEKAGHEANLVNGFSPEAQ